MKKLNLLWSLLLLFPAINAMQQEQSDRRSNFIFLDFQIVDSPFVTTNADIKFAALVTSPDLDILKEVRNGIGFSYPEEDESDLVPVSPFLVPMQDPNPAASYSGMVRQLNPRLAEIESKIIEILEFARQPHYLKPLFVPGDTIGQNTNFIEKILPRVKERISECHAFEMAAMRTAVKLWNPRGLFQRSEVKNPDESVHSLLQELKYYRTRYFRYPLAERDLLMTNNK